MDFLIFETLCYQWLVSLEKETKAIQVLNYMGMDKEAK